MKEVMKHILELAYEINAISSEYFIWVDLKPKSINSVVHIFNAMTKESVEYTGSIYDDECLPARLIFAEGRLEDILKELQGR